jgi:hypothetical protein
MPPWAADLVRRRFFGVDKDVLTPVQQKKSLPQHGALWRILCVLSSIVVLVCTLRLAGVLYLLL